MVPRLAEEGGARGDDSRGSGGVAGISPSILIIAVIVVVMLLASISIHYFIRSLCRRTSSSAPPLPLVAVRSSAVAPAAAAPSVAGQGKEAAVERERLIERLPLFTLASSLAALPRSSRDCAVCQSVFGGDEELRLLPACRHAFHSRCVDPWLRANPSCPLCRASIALPHPPLPELLRVELGSVSSRRSTSSDSAAVAAAAPRAYPLPSLPNSTTEYLVE
jgi:E3 ubiquitin-protein ligase ATL4